MLAEATKKNLYHKLVEEDCITFIAKTTDSNLIIAADLLPYLADPAPLFSIIAKQTPAKSLFIFSFENSQKDSWHLSQHARFKHNPQEVITQLKSLGFKILEHHQTTLRYNQNKPVEGSIVSCVTSM